MIFFQRKVFIVALLVFFPMIMIFWSGSSQALNPPGGIPGAPGAAGGGIGLNAAQSVASSNGLFQGNLAGFITSAIKFLLAFVGIIAVAAIIYGGFLYITDAGSEKRAETGKKVIIYAIIGLIVIGAAALVTNVVISTFK